MPEDARRFAGQIASLITGRALCEWCIAQKTGLSVNRVDELIQRIGRTLRTRMFIDVCEACQTKTVVHEIGSDFIHGRRGAR